MLKTKVESYLKTNKEDWRNIKNYQVGDILSVKYQYAGIGLKVRKFVGICMGKKQKNIGSSILLRNVISNKSVEMYFFVDSNKVVSIQKLGKIKSKVRRSKLYYLREKPLSKSKVTALV
jgi:large subunit ribosomal protein L19